ncbi:MAG: SBBP repeat-containing protein [Promethearchaeota archaeon]
MTTYTQINRCTMKKAKMVKNSHILMSIFLSILLIGIVFSRCLINLHAVGDNSEIKEEDTSLLSFIAPELSTNQVNLIEIDSTHKPMPWKEDPTKPSLIMTKQTSEDIEDKIGDENGRSIAIDSQENIILVGDTRSSGFQTLNAYDNILDGSSDVFITKFNATGGLLWSTFLGGEDYEEGWDVAMDSQDNIYITGYTKSYDFPDLNSYDDLYNGGGGDVFITKFSPDGMLIWSTFLGGVGLDRGRGITVDSQDNILVTGYTASDNFPIKNSYNDTLNGDMDAFISKLTTNGTLLWSSYVGTEGSDYSYDITVDSHNDVFITGTSVLYRNIYYSDTDAFLIKFDSTGRWLWSTHFGGYGLNQNDQGISLAIDSQNHIIIAGVTSSNEFPILNASQTTLNGDIDAFVTKFDSNAGLVWSTFLGGTEDDNVSRVLVDSQDNIIVTGYTDMNDFPVLNAANPSFGGIEDGFITKFAAITHTLIWSTFLGGARADQILGACVGAQDSIFVTGFTNSSDFPTVNAYDTLHNETNADAFMTKLSANGAILLSTYLGAHLKVEEPIVFNFPIQFFLVIVIILSILIIGQVVRKKRRKKKTYQDDQSILKILLFSVPYSFRILLNNKRKYITLILSFTLVAAFVMSMFLWVELSPDVAIRQAMDQTAYHLIIERTNSFSSTETLDPLHTWLEEQVWAEKVDRVRPGTALFGTNNKSADYNWVSIDPNDPIYITPALNVLSNGFLDLVAFHFSWQGDFQVNQSHCLISNQLVQVLYDTLGWSLEIGDALNLSIATNSPRDSQEQLGAWERLNLTLYIGGIYERNVEASLTDISFTPETLGDGIFIANESLPDAFFEEVTETGSYSEKLFVRLDPVKLVRGSALQIEQRIEYIKDKINNRFYGFVIREQTNAAYAEITKYQRTQFLILIIFAPIIVCSAFLVFFWTNYHMKTRRGELRTLRSRGGNLKQVFGLISVEFLEISLLGGIPGFILGSFLTYFLVNGGQFTLDFESFLSFIIKLWDLAAIWVTGLVVCIGLMLSVSLWRVYKFVQIEMELRREQESNLQKLISRHALDIALLLLAVFILMLAIQDERIAYISESQFGVLFLICMLGTWIGVGHLLAKSVSKFGAFLSNSFIGKLGSQVLLTGKNFERRQENTFIVAMLLIITFSISAFVVVFTSSAGINAAIISDYETGSDFKIYTNYQNVSFAQTLEADAGIEQCMAIQKGYASIGSSALIQMYGVDALVYPQIGLWSPDSFLSGTPEEIFQRLAETNNGIILNDFLASQLDKEINSTILLEIEAGQIAFTVVGIVYSAPGLGVLKEHKISSSYLPSLGGVIVNGHEMQQEAYNYLNSTNLFLARAPESNDMNTKLDTRSRLLASPQIRHVQLSNLPPQDAILSLVGIDSILLLNLTGSLVILVVVIIFFFGTVVYERKTEFAIMRACGASAETVRRQVLWEELILLVVTVTEGYGLGVFFAWIFTNIAFPVIYYPAPLPYVLDIPLNLILVLLVITIVILSLGTRLSSKIITGQNIALTLKNL